MLFLLYFVMLSESGINFGWNPACYNKKKTCGYIKKKNHILISDKIRAILTQMLQRSCVFICYRYRSLPAFHFIWWLRILFVSPLISLVIKPLLKNEVKHFLFINEVPAEYVKFFFRYSRKYLKSEVSGHFWWYSVWVC